MWKLLKQIFLLELVSTIVNKTLWTVGHLAPAQLPLACITDTTPIKILFYRIVSYKIDCAIRSQ
jgi:hypothetical protein